MFLSSATADVLKSQKTERTEDRGERRKTKLVVL